ncbi:MAG: hypothetical protein WBO66_04905 [Candidatus Moraniibacteriota bacterium]
MSIDPRLGALKSEHRPALAYPIVFSIIGVCVFAGSVFTAVNGQPEAAYLAAVVAVALIAYLATVSRRRLFVHENGIRLRSGSSERPVLWAEVVKATPTYSIHEDPETLIDVSLRTESGPRLVLRMNWSNHKALRREVWSMLRGERRAV